MVKKSTKSRKLKTSTRIFYFVVGISIASILLVFSFQWDLLPFQITIYGKVITSYFLASIIVLIGIFASTMIKSSITGKKEVDI